MTSKPETTAYECPVCGLIHEGLPDVGSDRPAHWYGVPEAERDRRIELTSDTCVIDGEHFFVRGVVELPVHGQGEAFGLGVWVTQKRENFEAYVREPDSSAIGPFFGWLCTELLGCYGVSTLLLKTMVHFRGGGLRPSVELEPTDHPLAVDQRQGISLDRAWEIVHACESGNDHSLT